MTATCLLRIDVTAEHIRLGEAGDGEECPIALALCEETGKRWLVCAVHAELAERPYAACRLPRRVQRFVQQFDADKPVRPFAFDLEIGEELR